MEACGAVGVKSFPIGGRWEAGQSFDARSGVVDGFDEGEAAAAFAAVADGLRVVGDCMEEVFEDGFMAADVGYGGGRGALVGVAGGHIGKVERRIAQIGGDDASCSRITVPSVPVISRRRG